MKNITKWRIIIGNIIFAIAVSYFYFRIDAPLNYRIIVYLLLMIVLLIGAVNEYKIKKRG